MKAKAITRQTKTLFSEKLKIGTYKSYSNAQLSKSVYLTAKIKEIDDSKTEIFDKDGKVLRIGSAHETTDHQTIFKYRTLSICCDAYYFCGQSYDTLEQMLKDDVLKLIIPIGQFKHIIALWKRYHLNDLSPNCEHQKVFNCNENFTEQAQRETDKCPKGYAYGSKWLISPLPQEIQKEIRRLFRGD